MFSNKKLKIVKFKTNLKTNLKTKTVLCSRHFKDISRSISRTIQALKRKVYPKISEKIMK